MKAATLTRATAPLDVNWRLRGNCHNLDDLDTMHPDDADRMGEEAAKRICAFCPVATQCLTESIELRDWHGIRAGLTGQERRNLAANGAKRCTRCSDLFVPRLDTQVRCRPCARRVDNRKAKP